MLEVCKGWVKGPSPERAATTRFRRFRPFAGALSNRRSRPEADFDRSLRGHSFGLSEKIAASGPPGAGTWHGRRFTRTEHYRWPERTLLPRKTRRAHNQRAAKTTPCKIAV